MKSFLLPLVFLFAANCAQADLITSGPFSGLGTSTITTSIDEALRLVNYQFDGLGPLLVGASFSVDLEVKTLVPGSFLEVDQSHLLLVDNSLPQVSLSNLSGSARNAWYANAPERGLGVDGNGFLKVNGIDETFSKRDPYLIGFVYNDSLVFSGQFVSTSVDINGDEFAIMTPTFVSSVPEPSSFTLLGLLGIAASCMIAAKSRRSNRT
jgi:hypothetical protein